jgi:hypothetical protein
MFQECIVQELEDHDFVNFYNNIFNTSYELNMFLVFIKFFKKRLNFWLNDLSETFLYNIYFI